MPAINVRLPSKRIDGTTDVDCATQCAAADPCVGFSFNMKEKVCDLFCGFDAEFCDIPSFPVKIDKCMMLKMTDDLDQQLACFAKEDACLYFKGEQ